MYKQPQDTVASAEALKFFAWAYKNGAKMADELHYVPMPANVVADIQKTWAAEIKERVASPCLPIEGCSAGGASAAPLAPTADRDS